MSLFIPLLLTSDAEADPIPSTPILVMQLAECSHEDDRVLVGPHLMSAREIDEFVDRVRSDAEEFRRMAKYELDVALSRLRPR